MYKVTVSLTTTEEKVTHMGLYTRGAYIRGGGGLYTEGKLR